MIGSGHVRSQICIQVKKRVDNLNNSEKTHNFVVDDFWRYYSIWTFVIYLATKKIHLHFPLNELFDFIILFEFWDTRSLFLPLFVMVSYKVHSCSHTCSKKTKAKSIHEKYLRKSIYTCPKIMRAKSIHENYLQKSIYTCTKDYEGKKYLRKNIFEKLFTLAQRLRGQTQQRLIFDTDQGRACVSQFVSWLQTIVCSGHK